MQTVFLIGFAYWLAALASCWVNYTQQGHVLVLLSEKYEQCCCYFRKGLYMNTTLLIYQMLAELLVLAFFFSNYTIDCQAETWRMQKEKSTAKLVQIVNFTYSELSLHQAGHWVDLKK